MRIDIALTLSGRAAALNLFRIGKDSMRKNQWGVRIEKNQCALTLN